MYAIVDLETTGGKPGEHRITEFACYVYDGEEVVDEFSTLINPERKIPYQITRITGIDDKMVRTAPKFYEVARRIFEITDGKIFVAHNVNFDYGFLKYEFESLGGTFLRKKLCTANYSRKILPGKRSYSLGALCKEFGIEIRNRHRAAGDAEATVKLLKLLLGVESMKSVDLFSDQHLRQINGVSQLEIINQLPNTTGVYYFHDANDELIYIGKSKNIRSRVLSHFATNLTTKSREMKQRISNINFEECGSELIALLKESQEIKNHQPLFNRAQRRKSFTYGLFVKQNEEGYDELKLDKLKKNDIPLTSFTTKMAGRDFLHATVEKFGLCQKLCGLYPAETSCFHYNIGLCGGACIGKETAEEYNAKVHEAVAHLQFLHESFVLIDTGRNEHESSVVMVENGRYLGYGYLDDSVTVESPEEFKEFITHYDDNRDVRQIIKSFLDRNAVKKIIPFQLD